MNNALKSIFEDAIFDFWIKDRFEKVEEKFQYVKIITDGRYL